MSSLKDLYENPDLEEDSEDDLDFVPEDNESEEDDIVDSEEEEDTKKEETKNEDTKKQEEQSQKSKIDAIWADMNKPSEQKKAPVIEEQVSAESSRELKRKALPIRSTNTKRPKSNLNSLMDKYKIKEPKLNTLEKSKLDWQGFVKKEGIEDELKYKNKDGYMEKVAFLNRVDDRRLSQLKQGQNKKKDL